MRSKTKKSEEQKFGQAVPPITFDDIVVTEIIISKDNGNYVVQAVYNLLSSTCPDFNVSKRITFKQSDFGPLQINKFDKIVEIVTEKIVNYLENLPS